MIVVYSMKVNIHDNIMDMGGITGVATYPEYTGKGLIHSLMKRVVNYMHEQEFPISFLYPYSIPFYRKMGWEIVSDKLTFTVKDTQLPKARPVTGMVAVSYTHLDVYKRQPQIHSLRFVHCFPSAPPGFLRRP